MAVIPAPMKTVIMAGGRGTRISSLRSDIPKPMIDVCGRPVLQRTVEMLCRQGHDDIVLVVGHLANAIIGHFGDGSRFGARIEYFVEEEPLGTAGALVPLRDSLGDDFLLLNGDVVMDVDFERMEAFHRVRGALATIATHPNSHPHDSSLVVTDGDGRVTGWLSRGEGRPLCRNRVNAGAHVLSAGSLEGFECVGKLDLDRDVLMPLVKTGGLLSYSTTEYIKDMGTPERYAQVCREVAEGLPGARNLSRPQRAVFLDRDGTLNVHRGFVTRPEEIELIPGTAEAVRRINQSGYLAIVVTNQPVIARGDCTWEELDEVNAALDGLLGKEGAFVDDIFICPHHPDRGFEGERSEYKLECDCRKPKPGLLLQAAERYNIDLSASWMVGDSLRDVGAGEAAGCRTYLVGGGRSLLDFCEEYL